MTDSERAVKRRLPMCTKIKRWWTRDTVDGYFYIGAKSPYVRGVVGADIKLSFSHKIRLLFSKGVSVYFMEDKEKIKKVIKST